MTLYQIFISFTLYPDIWKVEALALELFGGYTANLCKGQWHDENKQIFTDRTEHIQIVTDNSELITKFIAQAKEICKQKSVLVVSHSVLAEYL